MTLGTQLTSTSKGLQTHEPRENSRPQIAPSRTINIVGNYSGPPPASRISPTICSSNNELGSQALRAGLVGGLRKFDWISPLPADRSLVFDGRTSNVRLERGGTASTNFDRKCGYDGCRSPPESRTVAPNYFHRRRLYKAECVRNCTYMNLIPYEWFGIDPGSREQVIFVVGRPTNWGLHV